MITNYNSLTVGKHEALLRARADHEGDTNELNLHVLSILSDMTVDELLDLKVPEFRAMMDRAGFLCTAPRPSEVARQYRFGDLVLVPVTDVRKMTAAQYIDFQNFSNAGEGRQAELLSCFLVPKGMKYNDGYDILEVQQAIRDFMPVTAALGLLAFFLRRLHRSTISILRSSVKRMQKSPQMAETIQATNRLIRSLQSGDGLPMSMPFLN